MFRLQLKELKHRAGREDERKQNGSGADDAHDRLVHPLSEQTVNDEACGRKQRDQPDQIQKIHFVFRKSSGYHFIRSISLMFIVSLFLNIAITIPRPTAASAAATVITKMAKT